MKARSVLLAMAVGLPVAGGCYTYNITEYHADTGVGGTGPTSTSTSASTGETGTSASSSVSSTGSGLPLCQSDSKGFNVFGQGAPCALSATTPLDDVGASKSCRIWRQSETAPWFDPGDGQAFNGSVWLDTGCSEVTPDGIGPVLYRAIPAADLETHDYAIWATVHFELGGPEGPFGGAGLLMRSTTLAAGEPYAIMDVYRTVPGDAHTAIWALNGSGLAEAFGDQTTVTGSFDTRIGLCYRASDHQIHGFEVKSNKFVELPAAYDTNFAGDVILGFAAHAYGSPQAMGHTLVRFQYAGWGRRATSMDPCPGAAGFMPEN